MVYRIALCDDDPAFLPFIKNLVGEWAAARGDEARLSAFPSAEALWMDGGLVAFTNAYLSVGSGDKTIDGGYVRLNGGEISLRAEADQNAAAVKKAKCQI